MEDKVINGDCLEVLKTLPENSVDSIVTDPPYELGFMGKSWDSTGIANNKEMWAECLRVLKPGGHLLSFSGTRTYHRMAVAIEDAGFEVRDMIEWVYGSGFPKSRNIGLDVDKRNGVTKNRGKAFVVAGQSGQRDKDTGGDLVPGSNTMGAYVAQNEWSGWGTALKPAHEPICMARKPLAEKTVAENCLKWGTGGLNIDESRVGMSQEDTDMLEAKSSKNPTGKKAENVPFVEGIASKPDPLGRFPANLIHDNSEEVRECFPETGSVKGRQTQYSESDFAGDGGWKGDGIGQRTYDGSGNVSRFFKSIIYQAKASKSERNRGCEGMPEKRPDERTETGMGTFEEKGVAKQSNFHPTVKPIALMEYLIKMVTPKGGVVLDPFAGSGSTLVAAKQNGFGYIGIEQEAEYVKICEARIEAIPETLF